jgi:hypothetical protein
MTIESKAIGANGLPLWSISKSGVIVFNGGSNAAK